MHAHPIKQFVQFERCNDFIVYNIATMYNVHVRVHNMLYYNIIGASDAYT